MIKRFLLSLAVIAGCIGAKAQMNPELPLNPDVLSGVLPNGLHYYILHNEEPKNRANFYIAQKVGSSLETPEQLGLAHFLEHMAFNGTSHFPGKNMLNYLQGKGIRFGADINAYTSFDETVYNVNNVPTNDQALMDSVLLVLHDWSCSILLEEDEIDAERGVIEGEYISRNDASNRMFTAILPQLYEEYQYRQMPIGSMEVVKNFPPQALRDYYKKWYRPDLQGIVIVGDFDAEAMEQKVKDLFSTIEMPENAAERVYPTISDNVKPIFVTFEDPELQIARIDTYFKFDRTPIAERNTLFAFLEDQVISQMVATMINNRLDEYSQKPDCPYSYAGVSVGTYLVSDQKGSFNVIIIPKTNYEEAYQAAMGIVVRACKTGFMGTELERVRDELLAEYETKYNEKDKTNSEQLGREIINHFVDNEATPGIEITYQLLQQLLPNLPEDMFNEYASSLVHIDNVAVVVTQPTTLGLNIPAENAMITALNDIINADYEPYVDEVITEPLISQLPTPGSIVSEKEDAELGTKEYMLSNGVKVVTKATDFANDEILFQMFKAGGKTAYPSSMADNLKGLDFVLEVSNVGPFNTTRLQKYLAGKKVALNYQVGNYNNYFTGGSTVKDIQSLFELLYASCTDISADYETFEAIKGRLQTFLANQSNNPEYVFQQRLSKEEYPEYPAAYPLSLDALDKMDYDKILEMYKESVSNAADYTVTIIGNIDENTLKPLLEQYVATLPSTGVATVPVACASAVPAKGKKEVTFDIAAQSPSVFFADVISQSGLQYTVDNDVKFDLAVDVLQMIFLETLREEMGGTYSPSVWGQLSPYTSTWAITWYIVTNEEVQQALVDRANAEFAKLMTEGTDSEHFTKVKEAAIKQYENQVRTNNYWQNALLQNERGFNPVNGRHEAYETITLDELNTFIKGMYNGQNKIEVIGIAK